MLEGTEGQRAEGQSCGTAAELEPQKGVKLIVLGP